MNTIISIIVPVYKKERYIQRCIESILTQTLQDGVELIIVNDATPDNSIVIAEQVIRNTNSRISSRIINHTENKGVSAARKTAFDNAQGQYITFVDGDDFVSPDYIESLYSCILENNDCDIAIGNYYEFHENRESVFYQALKTTLFADFVSARGKTSLCANLYRRTLFSHSFVWEEGMNYGEDYIATIQLVYYARKISYIDKGIYFYYQSDDSISRRKKYTIKDLDDKVHAATYARDFIRQNNIEGCKRALLISCLTFKYSIMTQAMTFSCDRRKYMNLWPDASAAFQEFYSIMRAHVGILGWPLLYSISHCNYSLFYLTYNLIKIKKLFL